MLKQKETTIWNSVGYSPIAFSCIRIFPSFIFINTKLFEIIVFCFISCHYSSFRNIKRLCFRHKFLLLFKVDLFLKLNNLKSFAPLPLQKFLHYYDSICPYACIDTLFSQFFCLKYSLNIKP